MALVTPLDAIVLAGGRPDEVAATQPGVPNKAFVRIGGASLVARVIDALRASANVARIVVVAPNEAHAGPELARADRCLPDGARITDSLRSGLSVFPKDRLVLVAASDLPVLTPAAIDDFAERADGLDADAIYGCVERGVHLARFPQVPHTWVRLREGTFCGGGLMALRPRALPRLEHFIERLGAARKNPLRLARLFGWDVLLRYAAGRLTIADAEARASALLGAPVRALVSPYAETAVNVDRESDVALAEALV
ncbi:MAG TPA: nucleotidyltransferase family protein [Verrucomicrobiae bacterium]|nr:nucleotidyltransferase family protein [Verrucomicrobiae bacterium]